MKTEQRDPPLERVAFDFDETAQKFGRDRSWVYREVKKGNLKAITGFGKMMIAASEIERVLSGEGAVR